MLKFGEWRPDTPHTDLIECQNVLPTHEGYGPIGGFAELTDALGAKFYGGGAFIASDGTSNFIAGTTAGLYRWSSGSWSTLITQAATVPWRFAQFGDNLIAVSGGAMVSVDLLLGTAATVGGDAPTAIDCATLRDFVIVAQPDGDLLSVQWSGFNDSTEWTTGTNQSDTQPLPSGGEVLAVVGGEYGLVFQKNAIQRLTYVGDDIVFQRDEISSEVGTMATGSVVKAGSLVFFLSERGFMVTNGGEPQPIGEGKVDKTFFAKYARQDIEQNISAAIDPRRSVVFWCMPGGLWAYHWELQRWSFIKGDFQGIFTAFTANISLEGVDVIYTTGIDNVPVSLDSPEFAGGNPLLCVANSSRKVGTLTGDNLTARIAGQWIEPAKGHRTRMYGMRIIGNGPVSGRVDARLNLDDDPNVVYAAGERVNGWLPIRANGRFFKPIVITIGNFTHLKGIDFKMTKAGER